MSNGAKLAAGTNPFSGASSFAVTASSLNPDNSTNLIFPTVAGKVYTLQTKGDLSNLLGWSPVSPAVRLVGDGTTKTLSSPVTAPGTTTVFYRVQVQDMDTDGGGISHWA